MGLGPPVVLGCEGTGCRERLGRRRDGACQREETNVTGVFKCLGRWWTFFWGRGPVGPGSGYIHDRTQLKCVWTVGGCRGGVRGGVDLIVVIAPSMHTVCCLGRGIITCAPPQAVWGAETAQQGRQDTQTGRQELEGCRVGRQCGCGCWTSRALPEGRGPCKCGQD